MNREDARRILVAWRPGMPDLDDPEIAEALKLATRDPELAAWLEQHAAFQSATQQALRSIPTPPDLADAILARRPVLRPAFHSQTVGWLAAAALLIAVGLAAVLFWPKGESDFDVFRSRMVRAAIREYRMDIVTNDLAAIREFLKTHAAPSDFELTPSLATLQPAGAGLLTWHGQPVAMVCLKSERAGMFYLFVMEREQLGRGAPTTADIQQVSRLATASWERKNRVYVLAASTPLEEIQSFL
jgi:hypothetical protein